VRRGTSRQLGGHRIGFNLGDQSSQKADALGIVLLVVREHRIAVLTVCFGGMLE
jgi:hypothetical protein